MKLDERRPLLRSSLPTPLKGACLTVVAVLGVSIWILLLLLNACQPIATTVPAPTSTDKLLPTVKVTPSRTPKTIVLYRTESSPPATLTSTPVPTLTPSAIATQKKEIAQKMTSTTDASLADSSRESVTITIVYDNNAYDPRLRTAWGFAALIEYRDQTLLFDTGGDGMTLLNNMQILGIDPNSVESVALSHAHGDHTGGLSALLATGARPTVYLPPSFPKSFKDQVSQTTTVVEVTRGQSFGEGLFTIGEIGRGIPEQALVVRSDRGLVVVTGCAHPGIVEIITQAKTLFDDPVHLVLGGFHLGSKSEAEISAIVADFRRLEVEKVAPCHCTGEQAISRFADEYDKEFLQAGVGRVIIVTPKTVGKGLQKDQARSGLLERKREE